MVIQKVQRYYLLVGDENNWRTAIKENMWGFSETTKGLWNTIQVDEIVGFYVTQPFSKIIGFGQITHKKIDESLLWDDELNFNRSLWKYRVEFMPIFINKDWKKGIRLDSNKKWFLQSTRVVIKKNLFFELVENADKSWKTKIKEKLIK